MLGCPFGHPRAARGGSGCSHPQGPHPNQVVDAQGQREVPSDLFLTDVTELAEDADGLEPAEDFLDALAGSLADVVARVPGGPAVDGRRAVALSAGNVRGHLQAAQRLHEGLDVVALVGPQRDAAALLSLLEHLLGRLPLGSAAGLRQAGGHYQTVAVLGEHMTHPAELGLLAQAMSHQLGLRVGRRGVRVVGARLALEVHLRVATLA